MARGEANRLGEMEAFALVCELGGFSAAARAQHVTPSAISRLVARLEARLGARLVNRTTRSFRLTPEGAEFYDRAARILSDIAEAERAAGVGEAPVGRVRVNTSATYAVHRLEPILPEFLALHPGVSVDLAITDAVVDLLADRADLAVRAGPMPDSSLFARKLGETAMAIVAAPAYLEQRGEPATIEELERHERIGFSYVRATEGWPLRRPDGGVTVMPVSGRLQASEGEALRRLAVAGAGLVRMAEFAVSADIEAGRLRRVMTAWNPGDSEAFHAVHVGRGGPVPARVRALLDFLSRRGRVG